MYNEFKASLQNELAEEITSSKSFSWKTVITALELLGLGM